MTDIPISKGDTCFSRISQGPDAAMLSSSSSKSSLSSQIGQLQEDDDDEQQFIRKFDIFVQYLDPKGVFIIDSKSLVDGRSYSVQRQYEDFQALHDLLETLSKAVTIIPPLPKAFQPEERRISVDIAKTMSDYKLQPTNAIEFTHYLGAIVDHPALASIAQVDEFLLHTRFARPEIETRKDKRSSFLKFVSNKFNSNGGNHRDCDDFYENQRYLAMTFDDKLQPMKAHFDAVLIGNDKLCNVISHLSTCIISTLVINDTQSSETMQFNKEFCSSLERYKTHLETSGALADDSLRATLDYLFAYNLAYRKMLSRRTELMVNYENTNRNLLRQLDTKHFEKASAEKNKAEYQFEQFNESGRQEIERYHSYRGRQFVHSIYRYVESQLAMSKHTATLLKSCISNLKREHI